MSLPSSRLRWEWPHLRTAMEAGLTMNLRRFAGSGRYKMVLWSEDKRHEATSNSMRGVFDLLNAKMGEEA